MNWGVGKGEWMDVIGALEELVGELAEDREGQQLPVGFVQDVDEEQDQLPDEMEFQPGLCFIAASILAKLDLKQFTLY